LTEFPTTKYFLLQIKSDIVRFDIDFLDPRNEILISYLKRVAVEKELNIKNISSICRIFSGKTAEKYVDGGNPLLKVRNITGIGIDWDTDYVDDEFFTENESYHINKDDILLTTTGDGTIGRVDIYDKDEPCMTDGHVTALRILDPKEIHPKFLLYYLRTIFGQIQLSRYIVGSTGQTELNDSDIGKILVLYPKTIAEQEKMAAPVTALEKEANELVRKAITARQQGITTFRDNF
jgi:restriction endonuclease S subunit